MGDWPAVFIIGLAGAAHQAWSATLYTTVSDMFPKRAIATLTGIGGAAGSIGGIGFPIVVGKVLDTVPGGYALVFGFCSLAYVVAFV
ncbi:MAG: MFS transporter, partial [Deltaproteobacteria bacterium]